MKFIQLMKVTTTRFDDLEAAHEEWLKATEGQRTVTSEFVCRNRENPDEYWIMVEFPDHDAAMRNNELPATEKIAAKMAALVDRPTEFVNLDLIRVD